MKAPVENPSYGGDLDQIQQEALDFAQIGLYRFRFDGHMVFMDRRALRIFELDDRFHEPTDVSQCKIEEIIEYVTPKGAMRREIREKGRVYGREWSFKTLQGHLKWVVEDSYLVKNTEDGTEAIQVIVRDISDQKRAQAALIESEEKYRTLVETFPFALTIIQEGRVRFANQATLKMMGIESLDDLIGRDSLIAIAEGERNRLHDFVRRRLEGDPQVPEHYETTMRREDGTEFPAEVFVSNVTFEGRSASQLITIDISDRYRTQAALRASEERYRDILESMQEGYYEVDLKGSFTFFNKAMCRILGYDEHEMQGLNYRAYYADEAAIRRTYETYRQVYVTGEEIQVIDWRIRRKDGTEALLEVSISLLRDPTGQPIGFRGIVRNLAERRQAERKMREAEMRYRDLFENANDIMYTHDIEGCLTSVNRMAEQISGYSRDEILGHNIIDLIAPESQEAVQLMIKQKLAGLEASTRYDTVLVGKLGNRIPVEVSTRLIRENGVPTGIQGTARDITERQRAEEERKHLQSQLLHTQKLESLGVLAGGIAHDFNNLLVGIIGNAGLALARLPEDSNARPYVQRVEAAAQRAAALTNQMLAYAGKGSYVVRSVELSSLAREMSQLLSASISKKARLTYDCPPALPMVRGDVAQLHQVIINLVTNASDALGDQPGTIDIRTCTRALSREDLAMLYMQDELEPGTYVCLEVRDSGCGMDSETLSRIFDPFFSTKFAGRGLGLAAVLGILRSHRGAIGVDSTLGEGTMFRLYLPAEQAAGNEDTGIDELRQLEESKWRGHGLALVVDDEQLVRQYACDLLESYGFETLGAEDGATGVQLFQQRAPDITVVLLDMTMPGLDGRQVINLLRKIRSDVPIILSSGYSEQAVIDQDTGNAATAFIQKPYRPKEFIHLLRTILSPGAVS